MTAPKAPTELHSPEAERAVLGAIIGSDGDLLPDVDASGLQGRDFHRAAHRLLWELLHQRQDDGLSLERMAVYEAVILTQRAEDYGGIGYVSSLADDASVLVSDHIAVIKALATLRRVSQLGPWITQRAHAPINGRPSDHVAGVLDGVERAMERLESDRPTTGLSMSDASADLLSRLDRDPDERPSYSPTGIGELDRVIDGFGPGELIVLGGRASMGKSVGAVCVTLNMAMQGDRIAFASLEMPSQQQADRYVSQLCGVPYRDMAPKGLARLSQRDRQAIRAALPAFSALPIDIRDQDVYTLRELRTYARQQQARYRRTEAPLKGLVVDYIGLMNPDPGERQSQATTRWIKGMKQLAKELGIWVLCLAQINRAAEGLSDSIPTIANLADSTMMENTADIVIMTYRRSYYDDAAPPNDVDWIVGKQRGGPRNIWVKLQWDPTTGRHFDRPWVSAAGGGR